MSKRTAVCSLWPVRTCVRLHKITSYTIATVLIIYTRLCIWLQIFKKVQYIVYLHHLIVSLESFIFILLRGVLPSPMSKSSRPPGSKCDGMIRVVSVSTSTATTESTQEYVTAVRPVRLMQTDLKDLWVGSGAGYRRYVASWAGTNWWAGLWLLNAWMLDMVIGIKSRRI